MVPKKQVLLHTERLVQTGVKEGTSPRASKGASNVETTPVRVRHAHWAVSYSKYQNIKKKNDSGVTSPPHLQPFRNRCSFLRRGLGWGVCLGRRLRHQHRARRNPPSPPPRPSGQPSRSNGPPLAPGCECGAAAGVNVGVFFLSMGNKLNTLFFVCVNFRCEKFSSGM